MLIHIILLQTHLHNIYVIHMYKCVASLQRNYDLLSFNVSHNTNTFPIIVKCVVCIDNVFSSLDFAVMEYIASVTV